MGPETLPLLLVVVLTVAGLSPRPATAFCVPRNVSNSLYIPPSSSATHLRPPQQQQQQPAFFVRPPPSPPVQPQLTSTPATTAMASVMTVTDYAPTQLPPLPNPLAGLPIVQDAVSQFCKLTDYPDLCLSAVQGVPLPASGGPAGFLNLQMKAVRAKVDYAEKVAAELINKPGTDSRLASYIQVCADSYDDAQDNLDSAAKAVAKGDKGTLNSMLSALVDDFVTCEDGFAEMGVPSPLKDLDNILGHMGSNCLAIAKLIL